MPPGARLILAIDLGLAVALVGAIVMQAWKFYRNRRPSASER